LVGPVGDVHGGGKGVSPCQPRWNESIYTATADDNYTPIHVQDFRDNIPYLSRAFQSKYVACVAGFSRGAIIGAKRFRGLLEAATASVSGSRIPL